jgi:flagellar hook-basal body complex protein FliE
MEGIKGISELLVAQQGKKQNTQSVDFKSVILNALESVNKDQLNAEAMDTAFIMGETDNIHEVMIASQKAELSLSFAVEVRNKVTEAYKEIMRLQM